MHNTDGHASYVLGHSEQELARLERQAEIFSLETRDWLRRAGLKTGMHVLDVGCGVGDVSMIAAEMVGSAGTVVGIDKAAAALPIAGARAKRAGYDWVRFVEADVFQYEPQEKFDAVIGRFILMHLPDGWSMARWCRSSRWTSRRPPRCRRCPSSTVASSGSPPPTAR
jgi:2-polyprenyl-3-methyl-5-hydroxy-6-metoxy-1,4-benzoquinol methylase